MAGNSASLVINALVIFGQYILCTCVFCLFWINDLSILISSFLIFKKKSFSDINCLITGIFCWNIFSNLNLKANSRNESESLITINSKTDHVDGHVDGPLPGIFYFIRVSKPVSVPEIHLNFFIVNTWQMERTKSNLFQRLDKLMLQTVCTDESTCCHHENKWYKMHSCAD